MAGVDLTESFIVVGAKPRPANFADAHVDIDIDQSAAEIARLRERPLPTSPDGYYRPQSKAAGAANGKDEEHSRLYNLVDGLQQAVKRGPPVTDPKALDAIVDALINKDAVDDRKGFFTTMLSAITKLSPGPRQDRLNDEAMALLYNTLPHPPATRLGKSQFRSADGGGNDMTDPDRGRARTPYARSVQGKHPQPSNNLPDPGLVFDTLLKARDFQKHPGENSALTFAFASIVTHSLFRTDLGDWTQNNTSSYLDLSPLYGVDQVQQDSVRDIRKKGRGLLYPDTFAEERLGFLPAAVSVLLVIFSRNHNYIANMLLKINERGTWTDPPPLDTKERDKQDEEIFQTARLVNCGHFMAMIFGDYVAGFLGLGRDGNTWSMNPFDPIVTKKGYIIPRGQGNHVSVEFNLLYRWHATTAQEDIKWTEDLFNNVFKLKETGKTFSTITVDDVKVTARELFSKQASDPSKRSIGRLQRQADGTFSDDDLAKILHDATESYAGAYRARGTPEVLRVIEVMGMQQARRWGVCTMNEFRKFLGLKQFETFEEWNRDPAIANAARQLYHHVDNLELYPGLQAEDCMPLGAGSGICCGYTMTRAILADAIALVRGDRFYTTDFTPANLTSWGFQDCARDPDNGAFGAALPKLLFRHLPRHYTYNSVYALFSFFTPDVTKKNLKKLGIAEQYNFNRPKARPIPKAINTKSAIRYVFKDFEKYPQPYDFDMNLLTDNYGFILTFDDQVKHDTDKKMAVHALYPDAQSIPKYVEWFKKMTHELIKEKSFSYEGVPGKQVDIVRDVIDLLGVHWAADQLIGIPLKTKKNPRGLFTEKEVHDMLVVLFSCVFLNVDPEHAWVLRHTAAKVAKIIKGFIEEGLGEVDVRHAKSRILGYVVNSVKGAIRPNGGKKPSHEFLARLAATGRPTRDLVATVVGLAVGSTGNYSQAITHIVDFYLDDARTADREKIIEVCKRTDAEATELLRGYVREGMRLHPQFAGVFRTCAEDDVIVQGNGLPDVHVRAGDILFSSYKNAHRDPNDFPNPEVVDPTRPASSYLLGGSGFHVCPGIQFTEHTVAEIIRIVFSLPNLRRAPGPRGHLAGFNVNKMGTDNRMYVSSSGTWSPWPGSLHLVYDA